MSVQKACDCAQLTRSAWHKPLVDRLSGDKVVIQALGALAEQKPAPWLVRIFEQPKEEHGLPGVLRTNNGPEF